MSYYEKKKKKIDGRDSKKVENYYYTIYSQWAFTVYLQASYISERANETLIKQNPSMSYYFKLLS